MNPDLWAVFLTRCFTPSVFFDLGANDPFATPSGQQVAFKPFLPSTEFYLFEASAKHEAALIRSGEPYAIAVLGERDGDERSFYESNAYPAGNGDSMYREQSRFYRPEVVIENRVTTRSLDSLVEERGWPLPDFIKMDTQGSELDILRGGQKCLDNAKAILIECGLRQYNLGAPRVSETVAFLADAGLQMWDVNAPAYNSRNELISFDAVFLRTELFSSDQDISD